MEEEIEYRRKMIRSYKEQVEPLLRYLPWLEEKKGCCVSSSYNGEELTEHSMSFPVYDSTLLGFVKQVQRTQLLDRNYVYVYTRYHLRSSADELAAISRVDTRSMEVLTGVLSKYVLGGMTKGYLWPEAVEKGIFLGILLKFRELFELWDQSAENEGKQE